MVCSQFFCLRNLKRSLNQKTNACAHVQRTCTYACHIMFITCINVIHCSFNVTKWILKTSRNVLCVDDVGVGVGLTLSHMLQCILGDILRKFERPSDAGFFTRLPAYHNLKYEMFKIWRTLLNRPAQPESQPGLFEADSEVVSSCSFLKKHAMEDVLVEELTDKQVNLIRDNNFIFVARHWYIL